MASPALISSIVEYMEAHGEQKTTAEILGWAKKRGLVGEDSTATVINQALAGAITLNQLKRIDSQPPKFVTVRLERTSVDELRDLVRGVGVVTTREWNVELNDDTLRYLSEVIVSGLLTGDDETFVAISPRPARTLDDAKVRASHEMLRILSRDGRLNRPFRDRAHALMQMGFFRGNVFSKGMQYPLEESELIEFKGANAANEEAWTKAMSLVPAEGKMVRFVASALNTHLVTPDVVRGEELRFLLGVKDRTRVMHGICLPTNGNDPKVVMDAEKEDYMNFVAREMRRMNPVQDEVANWYDHFDVVMHLLRTPRPAAQDKIYVLVEIVFRASLTLLHHGPFSFDEQYQYRMGPTTRVIPDEMLARLLQEQ